MSPGDEGAVLGEEEPPFGPVSLSTGVKKDWGHQGQWVASWYSRNTSSLFHVIKQYLISIETLVELGNIMLRYN